VKTETGTAVEKWKNALDGADTPQAIRVIDTKGKILQPVEECYETKLGGSLDKLRSHILQEIPKLAFGEEAAVGEPNLLEYLSGKRVMPSFVRLAREVFGAPQRFESFRRTIFGRDQKPKDAENPPVTTNDKHYTHLYKCLLTALELMSGMQFLTRVLHAGEGMNLDSTYSGNWTNLEEDC
jgi:hypothetical protein